MFFVFRRGRARWLRRSILTGVNPRKGLAMDLSVRDRRFEGEIRPLQTARGNNQASYSVGYVLSIATSRKTQKESGPHPDQNTDRKRGTGGRAN